METRAKSAPKNRRKQGRYNAGVAGLYRQVGKGGAESWVFIYRFGKDANGKPVRRMVGLGSVKDVPLAAAQRKALDARQTLALERRDPFPNGRAVVAAMTFRAVAERYLKESGKTGALAATWRRALFGGRAVDYCKPILDMPIDKIDTAAILRVLDPIWRTKTATAAALRPKIESVLGWAAIRELRSGDNPARWKKHLSEALPSPEAIAPTVNRAAIPYVDVPDFMRRLRARRGAGALALEFAILTASRNNEVLGATVGELDLDAGVWSIPAERMKETRDHEVPLGPRALAIVKEASTGKGPSDLLFPSPRGKKLDDSSLRAILERMKVDATVHGLCRATFKTWGSEEGHGHPRELVEAALSHQIGDKAERAYDRGTRLQRRRALMLDWECFIDGVEEGSVINLRATA